MNKSFQLRRRQLALGGALAALPLVAPAVVAQQANLGGYVYADSSHRALGDAEVALVQLDRSVRTNWAGEFFFRGIPAGSYQVVIRHVGYAVFQDTATLTTNASVTREWTLTRLPMTLDSVTVRADSSRKYISPGLRGFEDRRLKLGSGYFVDEATMRRYDNEKLSEVINARLPGLIQIRSQEHIYIASRASAGNFQKLPPADPHGSSVRGCWVVVYLNGVRVYTPGANQAAPDFGAMSVTDYAAVEYYRDGANAPMEFSDMSPFDCGILALWTRER